mmetsp:Transcript_87765/g.284098  ORF Transcript_87765/g.284098 Transcript_87765/m.284098 type:complete len:310 (+) Transcript_87765:238-1167(+)
MPLPKLRGATFSGLPGQKSPGRSKTAGSMFAAPRQSSTLSPSRRPAPAHLPPRRTARRGFLCRGASSRSTSCTKAGPRRSGSAATSPAAARSVARRKTRLPSALAEVMLTMSCTVSVRASAGRRSPPATPRRTPARGPSAAASAVSSSRCSARKYLGTSGSSSGCHQRPMRGPLGGQSTVTSGRTISQAQRRPRLRTMASVGPRLRRRPAKTRSHWPHGSVSYLLPTPPRGATSATMASLSATTSSTKAQEPPLSHSTPRRSSVLAMCTRLAQSMASAPPPAASRSSSSVQRSTAAWRRPSKRASSAWV